MQILRLMQPMQIMQLMQAPQITQLMQTTPTKLMGSTQINLSETI